MRMGELVGELMISQGRQQVDDAAGDAGGHVERGYLRGRYGGVPLLGNLVPAETRP